MEKPKGGRGKRAPYETTHVRIPEPIKDRVERLKEMYVTGSLDHYEEILARDSQMAREYEKLLTTNEAKLNSGQNLLPSLQDAIVEAKKVLKSKKSTKLMITNLLTSLYNEQVTLEDLE